MSKKIRIIILAAGKGKRMLSNIPKVLHKISGTPIINFVINTAKKFSANIINIVYGYGGDLLKSVIKDNSINWVLQKKQLGTGHAIQQVVHQFSEKENILILYGDMPLISIHTLKKLNQIKKYCDIGLVTKKLKYPGDYGRIIRKHGKVIRIVEKKDANSKELLINEINTGIFIVNSTDLKRWLKKIKNQNSTKEYYITDIIYFAYLEGKKIKTISPIYNYETKGINNFLQLSVVEKIYKNNQIKKLLISGLIIKDPHKFDLRGKIKYGKNVVIENNVIIKGKVILGDNSKVGVGCIIKNSIIGNNCIIHPYSIIENTKILNDCIIGPFAVLKKDSKLESKVEIGNFVEVKKTTIGEKTKAKHLSYLGDSKIGKQVNVGAGTITCNFNGIKKHTTVIGNNVFIGASSQLIAPISISNDTIVAAGTTVMKDVISSSLVYNPKKQIENLNYKRIKNKKR